MTLFIISLVFLISGYFVYGTIVEKVVGINPKAAMPCDTMRDGVDYMPMATWRVFLIQFLNIAGLGPIFGAIMGITFGPSAFLWIVFGTIFAGAVHDFMSGIVSVRRNGASIPEIVGHELGPVIKQAMRVFSMILLLLLVAVFVVNPAQLVAGMTDSSLDVNFWIAVIFGYYILATILPIDKVIGNIYPVFGAALLFMAIGIMGYMIFSGIEIPTGITEGLYNRHSEASTHPLFPMMFVSIACGAISGFHATQSPLMARCLKNEKYARPIFYGAMVTEGIVALIWAAATIAFTGGYAELNTYFADGGVAGTLINDISINWLGAVGGILVMLGVVAAPITTGDTALRSARLIVCDAIGLKQDKIVSRLLVSVPLFVIVYLLMQTDYSVLWRYFAWSNQTLSLFAFLGISVWMFENSKAKWVWIPLIPGAWYTFVTVTFIANAQIGFHIPWTPAYIIGVCAAVAYVAIIVWYGKKRAARLQKL